MAKKDKSNEVNELVETESSEKTGEKEQIKAKKKNHFGRNFAVFIFLVLAGIAAFLAIQLKQTEASNQRALQDLQKAYEHKLSVISSRLNDLQNEVEQIKNKPSAVAVEGVSEAFVEQKLAQLKQEIVQYIPHENSEVIQANPIVAENTPAKQTQEVLLASGALIVRDLAEQGNKFEYEAEVLQILAQGNPQAMKYVEVMQKYAVSGITGKSRLIKSFDKIFADLNTAKVKEEQKTVAESPQNWQDKILVWAKKLFVSRKGRKRPVFNQVNDEVYTLVHEGNLGEALNELKTSEKYSSVSSFPLTQWQIKVADYLQFEHAVNGLIMNSLANLHLKEMEH
ncbi:MAG: hypothetical protein IJ532_04425 [Alphaproteobacteria bacterium]|nr:hypothetical protein [Alphaproteobacteria bacterium]